MYTTITEQIKKRTYFLKLQDLDDELPLAKARQCILKTCIKI